MYPRLGCGYGSLGGYAKRPCKAVGDDGIFKFHYPDPHLRTIAALRGFTYTSGATMSGLLDRTSLEDERKWLCPPVEYVGETRAEVKAMIENLGDTRKPPAAGSEAPKQSASSLRCALMTMRSVFSH